MKPQQIDTRRKSILVMGSDTVPDGWRHVWEWTRDTTGQVSGATLEKIVDGVARRGDVWVPVDDIRNHAFSG